MVLRSYLVCVHVYVNRTTDSVLYNRSIGVLVPGVSFKKCSTVAKKLTMILIKYRLDSVNYIELILVSVIKHVTK